MPLSRRNSLVLAAAVAVLLLAMGVRASFGLFMQPMGLERGFGREVFSFAFAIQNLVWGLGAPLFGALADKHGAARTVALSALLYALGLVGLAQATTATELYWFGGFLIGLGQAGTTFGVILGVVARATRPEQRSTALGIAAAGGSLGQFLIVPFAQQLISQFDWHTAMVVLSVAVALAIAFAPTLRGKSEASAAQANLSLADALRQAVGDRSYHYLFWSFFVCGFHTAFILLHLPAYVMDRGLAAGDGAIALALIGLFNVLGSYACGWLGGRHSKKALLAGVYALRAGFIVLLLIFPLSPLLLYVFAAGMGLLWLGTVPLTNGLVGQIYGLRYAATLYGVIFLGHQIGSFIGVWSGGLVYAQTGSYDLIWWAGIVLALVAAALSWPIDERPLARRAVAGAA